jgi:chromate transporter
MLGFATIAPSLGGPVGGGLIHGLKLVAVAVVAQAVWDMARRLCPDHRRAAIALICIAVLSILTTIYAQLIVIGVGATLGLALCQTTTSPNSGRAPQHTHEFRVSRTVGAAALILFCVLLSGLPALACSTQVRPSTSSRRSTGRVPWCSVAVMSCSRFCNSKPW